jgi:hypothetical protein
MLLGPQLPALSSLVCTCVLIAVGLHAERPRDGGGAVFPRERGVPRAEGAPEQGAVPGEGLMQFFLWLTAVFVRVLRLGLFNYFSHVTILNYWFCASRNAPRQQLGGE